MAIFAWLMFSQVPEARALAGTQFEFSEIPAFIVTSSLVAADFAQFRCLAEGKAENPVAKLLKGLADLDCDIATRMAFVHRHFIVDTEDVGNRSAVTDGHDRTRKLSGSPSESLLFVGAANRSQARIIAVLSSGSPERTTIVAVDSALKVDLLYDSFKVSSEDHRAVPRLCAIHGIEVVARNVLKVFEGSSGQCGPRDVERQFLFDFSSQEFRLSEITDTGPGSPK